MSAKIRCRHCGDVIGVYEPMIALVGGEAVRTSIAADARTGAEDCFHDACYASMHGEDAPEDSS
ncbi:MAG TPA: hypothetical protein VEJ23_01465 [Solirubrobacteraceae bacterium]|nr:hypothetical protein [Solirubrobacteraceae bacterium]